MDESIYPYVCSNSNCKEPFNLNKAKAEIIKSGVVYADCGDIIFQGYKCTNPDCRSIRFIRTDRNHPKFDLRNFLITPSLNGYAHVIENLRFLKNSEKLHDFLKFKYIPAWDEESVSINDVSKQYSLTSYDDLFMIHEDYKHRVPNVNNPSWSIMGIPCSMTSDNFQRSLEKEIETNTIQLRRLYPDIPKFRNLLTCLAPNRITKVDEIDGDVITYAEGDSAKEIQEKNAAWQNLLEKSGGKALNEAIIGLLKDKGIAILDENEVEKLILLELMDFRRSHADELRRQAEKVGFEETIWKSFKNGFNNIVCAVCTELALAPQRKELNEWVNKAEKGKALFIDALMGLGKTYSIVEALTDNPELSAVIFMPTKKLCEEIIRRLKGKIAANKGLDYFEIYHNIDNREFLKSEVYYADGIKEKECPYFHEIISNVQKCVHGYKLDLITISFYG